MKKLDFKNAKKELEKILKVQRDNKSALENLSYIYFLQENKEKFNFVSNNMIKLFPSEKQYLSLRKKAINLVLSNLDTNTTILNLDKKDKDKVADYFSYFASYQLDLKKYKKAVTYFILAVKYADTNKTKAGKLQSLSWCKLFTKNYKGAIESSLKAIELTNNNYSIMGISSNLAHAYLLDNQYEKAKEIYLKYKGQYYSNSKKWNLIILKDFKDLKERNITHPDMKKIEELLLSKTDNEKKSIIH